MYFGKKVLGLSAGKTICDDLIIQKKFHYKTRPQFSPAAVSL